MVRGYTQESLQKQGNRKREPNIIEGYSGNIYKPLRPRCERDINIDWLNKEEVYTHEIINLF